LELIDTATIRVSGTIDNSAVDHRVRLVFTGKAPHSYSLAGTQYSYIKRESAPAALHTWKADGWFEEPSPTWPLLNHVSVEDDEVMSVM
ncbi:PTS fructose transporter subunit IIA, partial [Erysipelatoclostridium ramosum]|nr:PTS fructose transporter subunit IIA [Thomasclavelia ramosa]